ncbi:MAG TPA: thrombospondin type 3 repeat-containing protein, partial [Pseudomonadales bacterium]
MGDAKYTRTAGVAYSDGRATGETYSDNGSGGVCTITSAGEVTNNRPGTCKVKMTDNHGALSVAQWQVKAKYAFHGIPAASVPDDSYAVSMTVQNSSNVDIASQPGRVYDTESPNVCTIDASGNVSNVGLGLCKMKVTIADYDNLVVRKEWNVSALVGETFTAQAGASGDNVIFTSETPQVCSVQTDGFVDNIKTGICTVRATNVSNGNAVTTQTWTVVADADRDGIADAVDNCPFAANNNQADLDNDEDGDACDTDIDGDNVDNAQDNCPLLANADQAPSIIPGIGQACYDPNGDQDNDGVADAVDNCPFIANADQLNTNQQQEVADGTTLRGDACDTDDDGDGVEDGVDNCPLVSNADQLDTNQDGVGDACERKFVDGELGNDSNDCSSWASACATITRGIEAAQEDGLKQVFIKKGIYRPLTTISLQSGISLIGGFAGGELQASEGDGIKNVTVISGDAGDDANQDASGVISDVADIRNSNLARLLQAQNTGLAADNEIQLIGLTLNAADSTGNGAALFASNARVSVIGGRMQANRANLGAGIYAQSGAIVQVRGTQLAANRATSGAAMYNNAATVVLNGAAVVDNATTAANGGALFLTGAGNLELQRSTLENNSTNGGGTSGNGAALYANAGTVTIGNATRFAANKAASGAALYLAGSAAAEIKNTEFDGNIANGNGGAVVFNATGVTHQLDSSLFVVNRAAANGGAVYVNAGNHVSSVNTTFYQNKAASNAAGDAASGQPGHGGAIALGSSSGNVALIHNTVVENVSMNGNGGGVYAAAGGLQLTASL